MKCSCAKIPKYIRIDYRKYFIKSQLSGKFLNESWLGESSQKNNDRAQVYIERHYQMCFMTFHSKLKIYYLFLKCM